MEKNGWKILAIVFIILFLVETSIIVFLFALGSIEEKRIKECYYDFCAIYPEARYENGVCFCYDYDVIGNLIVVDSGVLN